MKKNSYNLAATVRDNITLLLHDFSFKIKAKFLDCKCLLGTIYWHSLASCKVFPPTNFDVR
jgi:hypothetical protein